mmetsp:Transcript_48271/g.117256  ORF Transcript_48271/g.117256 Transcript_48271/m.117256 type:complete len:255 (-) Transcript_48271:532-1296(-)
MASKAAPLTSPKIPPNVDAPPCAWPKTSTATPTASRQEAARVVRNEDVVACIMLRRRGEASALACRMALTISPCIASVIDGSPPNLPHTASSTGHAFPTATATGWCCPAGTSRGSTKRIADPKRVTRKATSESTAALTNEVRAPSAAARRRSTKGAVRRSSSDIIAGGSKEDRTLPSACTLVSIGSLPIAPYREVTASITVPIIPSLRKHSWPLVHTPAKAFAACCESFPSDSLGRMYPRPGSTRERFCCTHLQ